MNHVQVLTSALNNAKIASEHSQQSASEAAAELASQTAMVGQAKAKVEAVTEQLNAARIDFEATQESAHKASASAQQAQNNANEAASHAAAVSFSTHDVLPEHDDTGYHHGGEEEAESAPEIQVSALERKGEAANHNYEDSLKPSNHRFAGY
jgi:Protein of unknown function (DUF745)